MAFSSRGAKHVQTLCFGSTALCCVVAYEHEGTGLGNSALCAESRRHVNRVSNVQAMFLDEIGCEFHAPRRGNQRECGSAVEVGTDSRENALESGTAQPSYGTASTVGDLKQSRDGFREAEIANEDLCGRRLRPSAPEHVRDCTRTDLGRVKPHHR
jgi:hypothetical protein